MRCRGHVLMLCLATVLVCGGAGTVEAQTPGILYGRVVVEGAGSPVDGATITLSRDDGKRKMTLTADSHGRFSHVGVRAGFYTVVVERDGFAPVEVLGVEVLSNGRVRLMIEATPADEAPFTRRVIRYRRPLVNIEDATMSTRIM